MAEVSIVTSVYNKAPWLERCLHSFLTQTFKDIEIIVINNGSTDNSEKIIKTIANTDSRIRVINIENNIGPAGAYALGIEAVNTDYFALCDSDDYIPKNYIEILYRKIKEHDADIAMCTNDMVWDNGKIEINKRPPQREIVFTESDIPKLLPQIIDHHSNRYLSYYLAEIGVLWAKLYKTSFVRNNNINYDKDVWIYCDWLFNFLLMQKLSKMVYTEDTLYHFYQSEGSVTRTKKMNWKEKNRRKIALDKFSEACCKISIDDNLQRAMNVFTYNNIQDVFSMYISHYPDEVTLDDMNNLENDIVMWQQMAMLFDTKMYGLTLRQKTKLLLLKNKINWPFVIKRKLKRGE